MADLDLTTVEGLLAAVAGYDESLLRRHGPVSESKFPVGPESDTEVGRFTGTFCTRCGDFRRMVLVAHERCDRLNPRAIERKRSTLKAMNQARDPVAFALAGPPPVFSATCLQCETRVPLVVDAGPPVSVVVLGGSTPGLATANTPPGVAFYLEQAYRARTRGAFTAAVAMYRVALEHLLQAQGFEGRTLHDRVEAAVAAKPVWIDHLDDQLMHALRELGNRALHANGGDVSQVESLDRELVREIENLFADVLNEIYEVPARREARREQFRQARAS